MSSDDALNFFSERLKSGWVDVLVNTQTADQAAREAVAVLTKNIETKADKSIEDIRTYLCPRCAVPVAVIGVYAYRFCPMCGQALEWEWR